MNRLFSGQSALRILMKTYTDLEGIEGAAIKYTKPDGTAGSFSAGVTDTEKGIIAHECIEGELDVSGWWTLWAFVNFADGRTAADEAVRVFVWDEGKG
jgi:hypothetical protein